MNKIKRICVLLCALLILALCGCDKNKELKAFSDQCKIDLTSGKITQYEDNHGGFHGDGFSLMTVDCSVESMTSKISESDVWHELPLSDSLNEFVYTPFDQSLNIPQVENGFYYFYDRHSDASDRYDDSDLNKRPSYNFTFAIYDSDSDTLYLCRYDT